MFIQDYSVNLLTEDKPLRSLFSTGIKTEMVDEVAEWLRRWTAHPARRYFFPDLALCNMAVKYRPFLSFLVLLF